MSKYIPKYTTNPTIPKSWNASGIKEAAFNPAVFSRWGMYVALVSTQALYSSPFPKRVAPSLING